MVYWSYEKENGSFVTLHNPNISGSWGEYGLKMGLKSYNTIFQLNFLCKRGEKGQNHLYLHS